MGTLVDLSDHFMALRRVNAEARDKPVAESMFWLTAATVLIACGAPQIAGAIEKWQRRKRRRR